MFWKLELFPSSRERRDTLTLLGSVTEVFLRDQTEWVPPSPHPGTISLLFKIPDIGQSSENQ
jgi:hypothetical protein